MEKGKEIPLTLHNEDAVEGLGWVTEEEKYSLLNESDVLIIPSQYEGQPLVMMEGLAAKCKQQLPIKFPDYLIVSLALNITI